MEQPAKPNVRKILDTTLASLGPRDFPGMFEAFFKALDEGASYSPLVKQLNDRCLEVQMMTCHLRHSWIEAGCSDEDVYTLLSCASGFDEGVMESAGFDLELELWSPGKDHCCRAKFTEKS